MKIKLTYFVKMLVKFNLWFQQTKNKKNKTKLVFIHTSVSVEILTFVTDLRGRCDYYECTCERVIFKKQN